MNRTAIINEILIRMDEILPPGEVTSHPFQNSINSVLDEAYRICLKEFPISLLDLSDVITGGLKDPGSSWSGLTTGLIYLASLDGTGGNIAIKKGDFCLATSATAVTVLSVYDSTNKLAYIPMPDNFIRIGQFKFTDWQNPAKKHITPDHQEYKIIANGAIAGSLVNPTILLTHAKRGSDTEPKKYLVCYLVATKDEKPTLYYVKYDKDDGLTKLTDEAIQGVVWKACSLLMQVFSMPQVKIAEERYQAFIISNMR